MFKSSIWKLQHNADIVRNPLHGLSKMYLPELHKISSWILGGKLMMVFTLPSPWPC